MSGKYAPVLQELLASNTLQLPIAQALRDAAIVTRELALTQDRRMTLMQDEMRELKAEIQALRQLAPAQQFSELWREHALLKQELAECHMSIFESFKECNEYNVEIYEELRVLFKRIDLIVDELNDSDTRVRFQEWAHLRLNQHVGVSSWVASSGRNSTLYLGPDEKGRIADVIDVHAIIRTGNFYSNVEALNFNLMGDYVDVLFSHIIEMVRPDNGIIHLTLSDTEISSDLVFKMLQEEPFPKLTCLLLSRCPKINAQVALRGLIASPLGQRLERLHLKGYGLTEADRRFAFEHMPALKTLEF